MKAKLPVPETRTAILQSYGYGPGAPRFTLHTYVKTLECYLPGDGEAYELIFACSETKAERRWGTYDMSSGEAPDPEGN
ncbi:MAG TPA: hypothetical protein VIY48_22275 [Candidatus Paceibacterota bacterium]